MSDVSMALAASLTLVGAVALGLVGSTFARRAERPGSGDLRLFALVWYGIAGALVADAVLTLLALSSWAPLPVVVAVMDARLLFPTLALFGFAGYLSVLYSGSRRWLLPLAFGLGTVYVVTLSVAATFATSGVVVQEWRGWYEFEHTPSGGAYVFADALNFLPPVLLSFAYARLIRLSEDAHARWRIAWIAPALAAYYAGQFFGFLDFHWSGFALLQAVLAVALATAGWIATRPPSWAERFIRRAPWTLHESAFAGAPQSLKSGEA